MQTRMSPDVQQVVGHEETIDSTEFTGVKTLWLKTLHVFCQEDRT